MSYKNPIVNLGGKKFNINMTFDFDEFIEIEEAKEKIENYIKKNGIPNSCICNITPIKKYK